MNFTRTLILISLFVMTLLSVTVQAKSFSADAVQIRNGEFSHARMFWSDGRVRFEYLENGVPMVRIYDTQKKKIILLDTENKQYMKRELDSDQVLEPIIKENKTSSNPCDLMQDVECTRLKNVHIDGRETVKWLITSQYQGEDYHTFQWIDKEYDVVVRQENLDGSLLEVSITDEQEMNGRKVRKHDYFITSNTHRSHSTQWYDVELNIVIRQLYQDGSEDELRNVKVEKVSNKMFVIPTGYTEYGAITLAADTKNPTKKVPVNPVNN